MAAWEALVQFQLCPCGKLSQGSLCAGERGRSLSVPSHWGVPGVLLWSPSASQGSPGTAEGPSCPRSPSSATKMPPALTCSSVCFPCCCPQHFSEFTVGLRARTPPSPAAASLLPRWLCLE